MSWQERIRGWCFFRRDHTSITESLRYVAFVTQTIESPDLEWAGLFTLCDLWAVEKMEGIYFFLTLCSFLNLASSHQAVKHLFMSDLAPYDSPHGPEQIHISFGNIPSEMTIMWSTSNSSEFASSVVLYGLAPKNYSLEGRGKFVLFTEGNPDGLKYIHRVVLQVRAIEVF